MFREAGAKPYLSVCEDLPESPTQAPEEAGELVDAGG